MRLPPLERLRVRNPNKVEPNPCMLIMGQVLCSSRPLPFRSPLLPVAITDGRYQTACWASGGLATSGCANVEQTLRACMDKPPAPARKASSINYHLERFSKQLTQKAGMKK